MARCLRGLSGEVLMEKRFELSAKIYQITGYLWNSMDIYGYLWIFITISYYNIQRAGNIDTLHLDLKVYKRAWWANPCERNRVWVVHVEGRVEPVVQCLWGRDGFADFWREGLGFLLWLGHLQIFNYSSHHEKYGTSWVSLEDVTLFCLNMYWVTRS